MKRKAVETEKSSGLAAEIEFNDPEMKTGITKIASWNVAGMAACIKKGFQRYVEAENAHILCLQETKTNTNQNILKDLYPFQYQSHCTSKKGYSGTAVYSKIKPIGVKYKIGDEEIDNEGRFIILEFEEYFLINSYIVNAGQKLERLDLKQKHYVKLCSFLITLQEKKPLIFCGDLNVAHQEIDLARPKSNHKTAGFTPQERKDFSNLLETVGLIDTFRHENPDVSDEFTYYSYRFDCRSKNIGWRLDYFLVSKVLLPKVRLSTIRNDIYGASDHVPIVLLLDGKD